MLNYAITDRKLLHSQNDYRRKSLVDQAGRWATAGIDYIQVREKDLQAAEQVELTRRMMEAVRSVTGARTKVLVNSRADVAVAVGADGVHLTAAAGGLTPDQVRAVFAAAGLGEPVVSVSCHSLEEVRQAANARVDAILFGPVFGKVVDGTETIPGVGIEKLQAACLAANRCKVFALGGVTTSNAMTCVEAGATGVAGIRLFLSENTTEGK